MSRINGDKARTAAQKRRGVIQRAKDRLRKAADVAKAKKPSASH